MVGPLSPKQQMWVRFLQRPPKYMEETDKRAEKEKKLKTLKEERDRQINRIFYFMLELLFIFGAPALLAVVFGKKLDAGAGSFPKFLTSFLVGAFVLSWILVVFRYRFIVGRLRETERQIEEIKKGDA